jgi:hypothetical protein
MISRNPIPFDNPATYQIIVEGRIGSNMSDRLGGMTICHSMMKNSSWITTLKGELNDQVALAGVLNIIYELHLPVISVIRLKV